MTGGPRWQKQALGQPPERPNRPGLALIAGGIPVLADGKVAGAIGVAGAMTGAEDRRIAEAAVEKATA